MHKLTYSPRHLTHRRHAFSLDGIHDSIQLSPPDDIKLAGIAVHVDGKTCIVSLQTVAEPTEPIPMSDMKPGEIGVIAELLYASCALQVGDQVLCCVDGGPGQGKPPQVITFSGLLADPRHYTVRIILTEPGESLLIECVADETDESMPGWEVKRTENDVPVTGDFDAQCVDANNDEPEPETLRADTGDEPDDQFERLADGQRKECGNCYSTVINGHVNACKNCRTTDPRGVAGYSHYNWQAKPIETALDDALRTGTTEEIVAAAEWERPSECSFDVLSAAVKAAHRPGWLIHAYRFPYESVACKIMFGVSTSEHADSGTAWLAQQFMIHRDRLGLFGEVVTDGD